MKRLITVVSALVLVTAASGNAFAVEQFNQNVTPEVINGSGVTNGSFTTDRVGSLEIGLRGKLRYDGTCQAQNIFNSNGDGTYSFNPGIPGQTGMNTLPACGNNLQSAEWSFDWSVNTDYNNTSSLNLDDYNYEIGIDYDPSTGEDFCTFDPITPLAPPLFAPFWDHSIGDNSTPQGGGTVGNAGNYVTLLANNNVAQNSWQYRFFTAACATTFDPTVDGTYDVYIRMLDKNTNAELARSTIEIIVGQGGPEPVPMSGPASLAALFAGLALVVSFFTVRRFRTA